MAAPLWSSGTLYLPGDLVQPITLPTPAAATIVNATFEAGNTGWILNGPWTITNAGSAFDGAWSAEFATGANTTAQIEASAFEPVNPGTGITASAMFNQGASSSGNLAGVVMLKWYTSADVLISTSSGNVITSGSSGEWKQSSVTATAPATTAKVRVAFECQRSGDNAPAWVDNFEWNLIQSSLPAGLIYKAVQAAAGVSGSNEPAWPPILGQTVVDNEVTWEAVAATRVEYTASPVLVSGATEPTWPTEIGGFVADGSIKWEAFSRRVEDENCPNSKVVVIVGSKVHATDRDLDRFCATANPLDWTTSRDAGYLPLGLQQANANDFDTGVLNQYRGNLVAFNASSFQNWQVDPDPAQMALLDQMDGVGSTWQQAAQPVANDLFYLAALGVRTVGIAGGSTNLQAGDVGMPIDPLVKDAVRVAVANSSAVRSTYYPSSGQYWLAFSEYPPPPLTISGALPDGAVGSSASLTYTASGGVRPYGARSITSGSLPPGLSMNAAGEVSGSYTIAGTYTWTVSVTDAAGTVATVTDSASVSDLRWYAAIQSSNYAYARSPDGLVWTEATRHGGTVAASTSAVGFALGRLYVAAESSAVTTLDEVTFTPVTGMAAFTNPLSVVEVAGKAVLISRSQTDRSRYSADGIAFSPVSYTVARSLNSHGLKAGVLVMGATNGYIQRCVDGVAFVDQNVFGATSSGVKVCAGRDFFYAHCDNSTAKRSADGVTWVAATTPYGSTAAGFFYGTTTAGDEVLIGFSNANFYYSLNHGDTWTLGDSLGGLAGHAAEGVFVIAGGTFYTSTSGTAFVSTADAHTNTAVNIVTGWL